MKNIEICMFLLFSLTSVLLSAQGKEARTPISSKAKTNVSAKDLSPRNVLLYTVNPGAIVKQSSMRNEGTHPTTYTKTLVAQGFSFTQGGLVKSECSCRYGNNYDYVSEPSMTFKAEVDGNFDFRLVAFLKADMASCNTKFTDMKTGKVAHYVWSR
jgi:hypothetical protein